MIYETIGFLELNSIAKGIEAADAMLKAAEVTLLSAKPSCPGKYHVLIHGEVAAVTSSIKAGVKVGGSHVIEKTVIPRVHPQVIEAINLATPMYERNALGILEFFSVTSAIMGADAAVKAAEINLIEVRLGTGIGGKSFVTFTGEVAAVSESCKAGAAAGGSNGMLVDSVLIPSPREEIFRAVM